MLLPSLLLLCTALPSACSNTSHPSKPTLPNLLCEEVPGLFPSRVHCSSFRSPLFVHAIGSRSHQIVIMYFHISFSHQRKLYCEYLWGKESGSFASSKLFLFSCSVISNSLQPHGLQHARLHCPSPSPRACSNSCPLSWLCHPTVSSSVVPFSSCVQSFLASGSLPMSRLALL